MSKPDYLPLWATSTTTLPATGQTNKVRPKESLQTIGWDMGQIPTAEEWNWQFNNMYLWIEYFADLYANATDAATADTLALRDDTGSLHFYNLYTDNDLIVTGNSSFTGTIDVTGAVTVTDITATTAVCTTFTVEDTATLNGTTVADTLTVTTLTVNTLSTFNTESTFEGTISSYGTNKWEGTQSYLGAVTFSDTVTFASDATFNDSVTFKDSITSTGTNTFSGVNTFSNKLNLQSSNLSSNGYTYLPNGVIMQWGYVALSDMIQFNDYEGYSTVTLPIAFPTGFLGGSCTVKTSQVSADSDCWGQIAGTPSKTQITVQIQNAGETTFSYIDGVYWTAIGN